jgi:hypothetical protein
MSIEISDVLSRSYVEGGGRVRHVRIESNDPALTLEEFERFIETQYPGEKFWRHKPSREERREFESDTTGIFLYARFSMKLEGK